MILPFGRGLVQSEGSGGDAVGASFGGQEEAEVRALAHLALHRNLAAPSQTSLGDEDNLYLCIDGDYAPEHWPVSVNAQIGHEQGAFADGKLDWQLGLAKGIGPISLSVTYSDSDSDGPGSESSVSTGYRGTAYLFRIRLVPPPIGCAK